MVQTSKQKQSPFVDVPTYVAITRITKLLASMNINAPKGDR